VETSWWAQRGFPLRYGVEFIYSNSHQKLYKENTDNLLSFMGIKVHHVNVYLMLMFTLSLNAFISAER
jgi:hypothetical protein